MGRSQPRRRPPTAGFHGRKGQSLRLLASIVAGVGIAAFVAAVMWAFGIPLTTILPTSAPILIGAITLAYMVQATD